MSKGKRGTPLDPRCLREGLVRRWGGGAGVSGEGENFLTFPVSRSVICLPHLFSSLQ